ncbi:MAG: hypothetical protein RLZZ289_1741 [Bacteroidota bacterium]
MGKPKPFAHGIQLAPAGFRPEQKVARATKDSAWKYDALNKMRMRFYFQAIKAEVKFKRHWWNNYCIVRIGAPGKYEFLCHETNYVATIIDQKEATKYRTYWVKCYRKSVEILYWLWQVQYQSYSWDLHQHLKQLIVTPRPILSEVKRYGRLTEEQVASEVFRKWSDIVYRGADKEEICNL